MDEDSKESSAADGSHEQEQLEEDEDEQHRHQQLIPPFLLDQKVFTCNLEQQSPKLGAAVAPPPQSSSSTTAQKPERYFEAVVKQIRHHPQLNGDASWTFLIHFKGWNARYDRWITASQLVPDTSHYRQRYEQHQQQEDSKRQAEVGAQKQKQMAKKQKKKEQATKPRAAAAASVSQQALPEEYLASSSALPFTLKTVMVEEWEKINRRGYEAPYGYDDSMTQQQQADDSSSKPKGYPGRSVHALPAAVTIRKLLKHFEKKARKGFKLKQEKEQRKVVAAAAASQQQEGKEEAQDKGSEEGKEAQLMAASKQFKQEVKQFCNGLAKLLEEALPACLLYAQERPQFQHLVLNKRQKGEKVSVLDVYGCEFLLRLIVRLPILMMGKRPPSLVSDLVVLLQQNRPACFKGKFRPPEYPHEWLDWEQNYFGDPNKLLVEEKATEKAANDNHGDGDVDGDLFT